MDAFSATFLSSLHEHCVRRSSLLLLSSVLLGSSLSSAQVFTVEREHVGPKITSLTSLQPTSVALNPARLSTRTREELIRVFQSEQGFAVRPFPLGSRGLILHANGPLSPSGNAYADELEKYGISAKPGDRVVISKIDIKPDRIVFEFNGGPDKHHRVLQHIVLSGGMVEKPLAQDDGQVPVGSRLSLVFDKYVPEMTGAQLRALIAPMLDFSLKTPVQAYADTLPPKLKTAVLNHEVLVGMNRQMVLETIGQPDQKVREADASGPFEEWIYGAPPHEVKFVRFNGNRVIRLEIADVGQKPVVRDTDETDGYFGGQFVHEVRLGDAPPSAAGDERRPSAPPSLRNPGEKTADQTAADADYQMKPVLLPPKDPATGSGSANSSRTDSSKSSQSEGSSTAPASGHSPGSGSSASGSATSPSAASDAGPKSQPSAPGSASPAQNP